MKNLAEFKKALVIGLILHTTFHRDFSGRSDDGKAHFDGDRDLGLRSISQLHSNSFALSTPRESGVAIDSWLNFPKAKDCEFDNTDPIRPSMTIFEEDNHGTRHKLLTYTFTNWKWK